MIRAEEDARLVELGTTHTFQQHQRLHGRKHRRPRVPMSVIRSRSIVALGALLFGLVACSSEPASEPVAAPLPGPRTPEALFQAWNGRATGFFERVRELETGKEFMYAVLLAPEAAQCSQLGDLQAVSERGSLRVDVVAPPRLGISWNANALSEDALVFMTGPGYEDPALFTPAAGDFLELGAEALRGRLWLTLAPDPVTVTTCTESGKIGEPASSKQCTCYHHSGATTTCTEEGDCCLLPPEGSVRFDLQFEVARCPALCDSLKATGYYECIE